MFPTRVAAANPDPERRTVLGERSAATQGKSAGRVGDVVANTILVTYDLRGDESSADYERLIKEIEAYDDVLHPLYSVWLLQTTWTAKEVRDDLVPHIDSGDRLLVWNVTDRGSAWHGLTSADGQWIKNSP
jgi:hypothetical protein